VNEPTTVGGVNEVLRRRWGVPGQAGPVLSIGSDIFPTMRVDHGLDPELAIYAGIRLGWASTEQVQVVGEYSHSQLRNPQGSNVLVTIERIVVSTATLQDIHLQYFGTTPASPEEAGRLRDARWGPSARTSALVGPLTTAAQQTGIWRQYVPATTPTEMLATPIVLSPGTGLRVVSRVTNVLLRAAWSWRERRLESWETS
jgi:hypothetical protein